MSERVVRCDVLDVLEVGGEALVLLPPDQVVRLSPIATMLFEVTERPISVDSLLPLVVERFGVPPEADAAAAVAEMIDGLISAGVLERIDD